MGAIKHLTISLRAETAARLRDRVATGEFADESAAIEDALAEAECIRIAEALAPVMSDDEAADWMRTEAAAALKEYDRDPSTAYSVEEVRAHLAADRALREKRN